MYHVFDEHRTKYGGETFPTIILPVTLLSDNNSAKVILPGDDNDLVRREVMGMDGLSLEEKQALLSLINQFIMDNSKEEPECD